MIEVTTIHGRRLDYVMEIKEGSLIIRLKDLNRNEVFQHGWVTVNWKAIWLIEYN